MHFFSKDYRSPLGGARSMFVEIRSIEVTAEAKGGKWKGNIGKRFILVDRRSICSLLSFGCSRRTLRISVG